MQYSPKLKKAMEQIKDILKENDIAAFVVLHTPGHSEFLNHVQTSYSCATLVNGEIRLRLKSAEIGIDKAKEVARDTLNMVTQLANHLAFNASCYIDTEKLLRDKWGGDDLPGEFTTHTQQNN